MINMVHVTRINDQLRTLRDEERFVMDHARTSRLATFAPNEIAHMLNKNYPNKEIA